MIQRANLKGVQFRQEVAFLSSLGERLLVVLETLNAPVLSEEVRSHMQYLQANTLKVLVVGEFNSGKSTVINALLGQNLLPAYPVPTTALLTEVKWGEQPRAVLHYRPSSDGSRKAPQEIACTQIETFLVITAEGENLYERVELFCPLPLCREGVEFLDSPGLDDNEAYLEATMQRVLLVDAVLFVLASDALPTREENMLIDRIRCAGHDRIFFLCNRFDLVEPSCREMVKQRRIAQLRTLTEYGDQYIFFTNAKGALIGRKDGSAGQFEQANIQDVEEALYAFLQKRGRVRVFAFSSEFKAVTRKALRTLSLWQQHLAPQQGTISEHCGISQRIMNHMDKQYQQMLQQFTAVRSCLCHETNVAAARFYLHVEDSITNWTQDYNPQEPCHTWDVFAGDAQTRLVKELTTALTEQAQREFQSWVCSILQPLLSSGLHAMARDLDGQTEQLLWQEAGNAENLGEDGEAIIQNTVTRIATAVVKYECFDWHPLVLIARLLEMASVQASLQRHAHQQTIRDVVGWAYRRELMATLHQRVSAIVSIVDEEIGRIEGWLVNWLQGGLRGASETSWNNVAAWPPGDDRLAITEELHRIGYELDAFTKRPI